MSGENLTTRPILETILEQLTAFRQSVEIHFDRVESRLNHIESRLDHIEESIDRLTAQVKILSRDTFDMRTDHDLLSQRVERLEGH